MIAFIIYILFVIYVYIKYKPSCLSETYYLLKYKWIFPTWISLIAFLLLPTWLVASSYKFLAFLSSYLLVQIGMNPDYKNEDYNTHYILSVISCVLSVLWSILSGSIIIPIIFGLIALILIILKVKNNLFWIENLAFLNIFMMLVLP